MSRIEQTDSGQIDPLAMPAAEQSAGAPSADAIAELWSPGAANVRVSVEDLLLKEGAIDAAMLRQARQVQANSRGKKISQILLEMGHVKEEQVQRALAVTLNKPYQDVDFKDIPPDAFGKLSTDFMKQRGCICLNLVDGRLTLGMVDPADVFLVDEVKRKLAPKVIKTVVVSSSQITLAIEAANAANAGDESEKFDEIIADVGDDELEIVEETKD